MPTMAVHNLTIEKFSKCELLILSLGLKHIPKHSFSLNYMQEFYNIAVNNLRRKLYIDFFFALKENNISHLLRQMSLLLNDDNEKNSPLYEFIPRKENKQWMPDADESAEFKQVIDEYINNVREKMSASLRRCKQHQCRRDKLIIHLIKRLKNKENIIIKPADKNVGIIILYKHEYKSMCLKILKTPTYEEVTATYDSNVLFNDLETILKNNEKFYYFNPHRAGGSEKTSSLTESFFQLKNQDSLRVAPFYGLPKIHKPRAPNTLPALRPIISALSTPTYYVSKFLHNVLFPLVKKLPGVCTSPRNVLLELSKRIKKKFNKEPVILCADINSLYPSIPIAFGIICVRRVLSAYNFLPTEREFLIELLEWVLRNNYCTFDNKIYHQLNGTAMGTPVAVAYANIVLFCMEQDIWAERREYHYFRRFIDDVFAIFYNKQEAQWFIDKFNELGLDSIYFDENSVTIGDEGIFLDLHLSLIREGEFITIKTDIFQKLINIYQYITPSSDHGKHIFTNLVLNELKRYRLICSDDDSYEDIKNQFTIRLLARGYDLDLIEAAIAKVPHRDFLLASCLAPKKKKNASKFPIVISQKFNVQPSLQLREIFEIPNELKNHRAYRMAYGEGDIIIGTKNNPNLSKMLVRSLFEAQNND